MALIIAYLSVQNSQQPANFLSNPQGLRASRLYLYYNTRYEECKLSGNFSQMDVDYGSSLEGALLAADKYGIPPENFLAKFEYGFTYTGWPYDVSKYKSQPDAESYRMDLDSNFFGVSTQNGVNLYRAVSQNLRYTDLVTPHLNTDHLNGQLTLNTAAEKVAIVNAFVSALTNNNPIYFGTLIESNFMSASGGFVPMPNISTFDPIGGHAFVIIGYGNYDRNDSTLLFFKFINSWGEKWGDKGCGYLPKEIVENPTPFGISAYAIALKKS
jgi:aminopeptidase C